jgi:hypothetical protein
VSKTSSAPSTGGYWSSCPKCARRGEATPKRQPPTTERQHR